MSRGFLLALGALALLLVVTGLFVRYERTRANNAEIQAIEHKGRADAAVESAWRADQKAVLAKSQEEEAGRIVASLRAKVQQLRSSSIPSSRIDDAGPSVQPDGLCPNLHGDGIHGLVVAQDELIQAQDKQISALKVEVAELTTARDAWHKAHDERAAECVQLQAALAAEKGLAAGNLWKGRIQGFAVGVASSYATGRMH